MRTVMALAFVIGSTVTGFASDTGPVIVIPGRSGVPVYINGRDASFAIVEGDWGLARSIQVEPTVYGGGGRYEPPSVGHYYPNSGRTPGYGRYEIDPPANRRLPPQAESYYRSWSVQSEPLMMEPEVPLTPPPVIVAPQFDNREAPRDSR